ncbi:MAG: hypothetical protein K6357_00960 [Elusimicrobiota bacterium]
MNFFKFLYLKTKENSHIFLFFVLFTIGIQKIMSYAFGFDNLMDNKEFYMDLIKSNKFYLFVFLSTVIDSFIAGGVWYVILLDKETSFSEYFFKCLYYFKRFFALGIISTLMISLIMLSMLINNKILMFLFFIFIVAGTAYFGIKISFSPVYIIKFDTGVYDAIKRSFQTVKGQYFWIILILSILKYFLSRNEILASFMALIFIAFICYLFFLITTSENYEEVS